MDDQSEKENEWKEALSMMQKCRPSFTDDEESCLLGLVFSNNCKLMLLVNHCKDDEKHSTKFAHEHILPNANSATSKVTATETINSETNKVAATETINISQVKASKTNNANFVSPTNTNRVAPTVADEISNAIKDAGDDSIVIDLKRNKLSIESDLTYDAKNKKKKVEFKITSSCVSEKNDARANKQSGITKKHPHQRLKMIQKMLQLMKNQNQPALNLENSCHAFVAKTTTIKIQT